MAGHTSRRLRDLDLGNDPCLDRVVFTDWQGSARSTSSACRSISTCSRAIPASGRRSRTTCCGLLFFVCIATPIGIFLAVLLDRPLRGSRIYQSIFFTPVVLSLAVVGFIWSCSTRRSPGMDLSTAPWRRRAS